MFLLKKLWTLQKQKIFLVNKKTLLNTIQKATFIMNVAFFVNIITSKK